MIANLLRHNQFPGRNVLLSMPSPPQIPTPHTKIGFDNLGFTRKGDQLTELSPTPAGLRLSETTITCYPEACVPKPIYCSRSIMYEFCNHHDQTLLSSSIYPRFNFFHCRQLLAAGPSLLLSQTHDRLAQYAIAKQLTEGIPLIIQPKSQLKLYILFKYLSIKLSFRRSRRQFLVLFLRLRLLLRLLSLQLQRSPRTLFSRTSSRSLARQARRSFLLLDENDGVLNENILSHRTVNDMATHMDETVVDWSFSFAHFDFLLVLFLFSVRFSEWDVKPTPCRMNI